MGKHNDEHGRVTAPEGVPRGALATWGRTGAGRTRPGRALVGRTIGAERERLETSNERAAARKKDKRKNTLRVIFTVIGFIALIGILVAVYLVFSRSGGEPLSTTTTIEIPLTPTIEVIDEDASATGGKITSRMSEYIALAESDFKNLGLTPVRAVLPTGTIREVDFYLDGYPGRIKMAIDRGSAVSVEDAERMLRHLAGQGITTFEYIDVRLPGRAYWK